MIFIVVKFETKPEWTERWPDLVADFTEGTRAEDGNLWFDWSRSLDDPAEYVLVEGFRDAEAGSVHVNSEHFKKAITEMPQALAVHAEDHQSDHRRHRVVRDGRDESRVATRLLDGETASGSCRSTRPRGMRVPRASTSELSAAHVRSTSGAFQRVHCVRSTGRCRTTRGYRRRWSPMGCRR